MQVALEHVGKVYANGVAALRDVCLEVSDGELITLVGPSGCGKTTTLRLVAGLETLSQGAIRIGKQVVNDLPPKDRDVAMVFQHPALYPHLTVAQNLAFALRLRRLPHRETAGKVRRVAETLGITDLLNRRPRELSGGQCQRVALGRALVREPACFLFDEPLSSLDPSLRMEMRSELKRLHRGLRATILHVTHDQEEAMTLGQRVVVLRDGQVQQVGEPLEVYDHPANRFVAGFFGSPPMNFLDGSLVAEQGAFWFVAGSVRLALPEVVAKRLCASGSQPITLGIRPENIHPQESVATSHVTLNARVTDVAPLGQQTHVRLVAEGPWPLAACWGPRVDLRPGSPIRLSIDLARAHFFGPDGKSLV